MLKKRTVQQGGTARPSGLARKKPLDLGARATQAAGIKGGGTTVKGSKSNTSE